MNLSEAIRTAGRAAAHRASAQRPGEPISETVLAHYIAVALTGHTNVRTTTIVTTIVDRALASSETGPAESDEPAAQ